MKIIIFVFLVVVLISSSVFSQHSSYEQLHCLYNKISDDPSTCLLGMKRTICGTTKCYKTLRQHCSSVPSEIKIKGNECGRDLYCDCDDKCSGCMTVNGERLCQYAENCIPKIIGKRNQIPDTLDYLTGHDRMVAVIN